MSVLRFDSPRRRRRYVALPAFDNRALLAALIDDLQVLALHPHVLRVVARIVRGVVHRLRIRRRG